MLSSYAPALGVGATGEGHAGAAAAMGSDPNVTPGSTAAPRVIVIAEMTEMLAVSGRVSMLATYERLSHARCKHHSGEKGSLE